MHGYGKRFIVRAEEILTAFLELERAIHEFVGSLIAEEVAKVNPALVLPYKDGKPFTLRYGAVNAMYECLKEHRTVQE